MLTAVTRSRYYLYMLFPMTHEEWKNKTHKENASIFIRNCAGKLYERYSVEVKAQKLKSASDVKR